jgi:hypothetical protein
MTPSILPSALRANLRLFKIAPGDFVKRGQHDKGGSVLVRAFERGRHRLKYRCAAIGTLDAVEEQAMQMDIEVSGRIEALDERNGTGSCVCALQAGLFDQKGRHGAIHHL